jgi:hypothetical protein
VDSNRLRWSHGEETVSAGVARAVPSLRGIDLRAGRRFFRRRRIAE